MVFMIWVDFGSSLAAGVHPTNPIKFTKICPEVHKIHIFLQGWLQKCWTQIIFCVWFGKIAVAAILNWWSHFHLHFTSVGEKSCTLIDSCFLYYFYSQHWDPEWMLVIRSFKNLFSFVLSIKKLTKPLSP